MISTRLFDLVMLHGKEQSISINLLLTTIWESMYEIRAISDLHLQKSRSLA
jgi:hypothetical protein